MITVGNLLFVCSIIRERPRNDFSFSKFILHNYIDECPNKHKVECMRNFVDCRCYLCIKCSIINNKGQNSVLEKRAAYKNEKKTIEKCRVNHFYKTHSFFSALFHRTTRADCESSCLATLNFHFSLLTSCCLSHSCGNSKLLFVSPFCFSYCD